MDKKNIAKTISIEEYEAISRRLEFTRAFTQMLSGLRGDGPESNYDTFRFGVDFFEGLSRIAQEVDGSLWEIQDILDGNKRATSLENDLTEVS